MRAILLVMASAIGLSGCQSATDRYFQQKMETEQREAQQYVNSLHDQAQSEYIDCYRAWKKNPTAYKRAYKHGKYVGCAEDMDAFMDTWADKGAYMKRIADGLNKQ